MATEFPKAYDPKESQQRWLQFWEERGYFHSRPEEGRKPYCIVIPPPNVTGALHMGHALNNTLQDVLIRWRRMPGSSDRGAMRSRAMPTSSSTAVTSPRPRAASRCSRVWRR